MTNNEIQQQINRFHDISLFAAGLSLGLAIASIALSIMLFFL